MPLVACGAQTRSDVIEVAADGQSARGSFITPGVIHSRLTDDGRPYCNVLWERYGSDFVLEDGEWKYLHEHVCPDILTRMDMFDWAHGEYERITDPNPMEAAPPTLGDPPPVTDPGPMHMPYSVLEKPRNTCPWPEPYETLDNDNSYASLVD